MLSKKPKVKLIVVLLSLPFMVLIALVVTRVITFWIFIPSITLLLILYYAGAPLIYFLLMINGAVDPFRELARKYLPLQKKNNWKSRLSKLGLNPDSITLSDESPKILYKYRDWNNQYHKQILLEQQLFFSSPLDFNDPFDCRIPVRFENLNDAEYENFINSYIDIFGSEIQDNAMSYHTFPFSVSNLSNEALREQRKSLTIDRENQEIFNEQSLDMFGVYCLSKDPENILMWSHYANNHSGICVGFKTDLLIKSIIDNSEKDQYNLIFFDAVNYVEDFPMVDTRIGNAIGGNIFSSKAQNWKYEAEWRIIIHFYDAKKRLIKVPLECVAEVYLGCKMNEQVSSELIKTIKAINPDIKIFRANREHLKYQLTFETVT